MGYEILNGDVLGQLRTLSDESVQTVITSPPYWGLRDYGTEGQIGLEKTPQEYVAKMVEVFREVRRVLRKDGTCWVNLGDSYAGSWGNYSGQNRGKGNSQREITNGSAVPNPAYDGLEQYRPAASQKQEGLKPKDLVGIPWRVAFALQEDGWWLRQDIIWSKPNPMPESVTDRCTKSHEYLFLLTKSAKYRFNHGAIKENASSPTGSGNKHSYEVIGSRPGDNANLGGSLHKIGPRLFRNKRDVWAIPTQPYRGAHFAVFPEKLVEPCVLAGSSAGDIVLDPFCGSGTVGVVARHYGRNFIGIELNPEYIQLAHTRIATGSKKLEKEEITNEQRISGPGVIDELAPEVLEERRYHSRQELGLGDSQ